MAIASPWPSRPLAARLRRRIGNRAPEGGAGDRPDRGRRGGSAVSVIARTSSCCGCRTCSSWRGSSRGTFPNYEQVVPKAHPTASRCPRPRLSAALRRVSVLSEERTKPVKFMLYSGDVEARRLPSGLRRGRGESWRWSTRGKRSRSGSTRAIVLDALGAQIGEQVVLEMKDGMSPGVVRSLEEEGALCVIMPMRIWTSRRSGIPGADRMDRAVDFRSYPALSYSPVPTPQRPHRR